jgi:twitching motility protein PilT
VLIGSLALASLIREGKTPQIAGYIQAGQAEGMQGMDASLEKLVGSGAVKPRDALDKALDKEAFTKAMGPRLS